MAAPLRLRLRSAVILIWIAGALSAFSQTRQIVLLYDERIDLPGLASLNAGFTRVLTSGSPDPVEIYREEMDLSRFDSPGYRDFLRDDLRAKYAAKKIDVVVAVMAPAVDFLLSHRDEIFPGIPIVFCGLDRKQLGDRSLPEDVTGVLVKREFSPTLDLVARLHPHTEQIVLVAGTSEFDARLLAQAREEFQPFEKRFAFTYLTNFPLPELLSRLSHLPPKTVVLYTTMFRDGAGQPYVPHDVAERISAAANAPVYGFVDQYVGHGIVGGSVYGLGLHGEEAAGLVLKILSGQKPQQISPIEPANTVTMFDARQLRRWKIDEHRLPAGSAVLFREPTVWDRYWKWIIGGISVCILQALLIAGLVANLIRRRRAEGSLAESERRFRVTADAAPVMIWMAGPDKLCTFFNNSWLNFTGRTMQQEVGNGWSDGVHAQDFDKCLKTYVTAFDARKPFNMQYRLRHRDGDYRWISDHGVPRYDAQGVFAGYIGACVDLTELLKREEALHDFEERVKLAADAAQFGVWEMDMTTRSIWMSDSARALFQFEPDMPITQEIYQARVHPEDRAFREAAVNRAIQTQSGYEIEYRAALPDGTERWIAGRGRCAKDETGELTRLIGVSADVTQRKLAEEEAQRHREEMSRLSRIALLGEMAASIAHEVNQPLAAIINNASAAQCFIDHGDVKLDTLREILVDIAADGHRAHNVISSIRNTIKKGATLRESVDLNFIVTKVAHMFQPDMIAHSCKLETLLANDLPTIEADPVQIHQVLINLVSNALDAMRDTPAADRNVQIATKRNGNGTIEVAVRDSGAGVPDEIRGRLFDQFFTTKEKGLGMGLAIVHSIIEAHSGAIEVENLRGGGAQFNFTLPISRETAK